MSCMCSEDTILHDSVHTWTKDTGEYIKDVGRMKIFPVKSSRGQLNSLSSGVPLATVRRSSCLTIQTSL